MIDVGFKLWRCLDCGAQDVGEMKELLEHQSKCEKFLKRVEGEAANKKEKLPCPLCGDWHEVVYYYKDAPLLACPKAEPDKIYAFNKVL